jgi:hypothetical protein
MYQERILQAADNNDLNAINRIAGAWRAFASSTDGAYEMATNQNTIIDDYI